MIFARIAFSIILEIWDLTTIGLISSRATGPFVAVFYSDTILPMLRYLGMSTPLRASRISIATLLELICLQDITVKEVRAQSLV